MKNKPECIVDFSGEESNIFFIEFQAMLTLAEKRGKYAVIARQIPKEVHNNAKDYFDAIRLIGKYVELIPAEDDLQVQYFTNRPENQEDGSFVANLVKQKYYTNSET